MTVYIEGKSAEYWLRKMKERTMWYLDCFIAGDKMFQHNFPVNTYTHDDLNTVMLEAKKILDNRHINGITAVRIGLDSHGQAPIPLDKELEK